MDSTSLTALPLPPTNQLLVPGPGSERNRQDEIAAILRTLHSTTVLRRDELVAEYVDLERNSWVGQFDQPPPGGNQESDKGISKAARELEIPGKTKEGRRKFVERALQVAGISAEAREAAMAAGLDNNRSALLEIAQGRTPEAQLKMLAEFVARKSRDRILKKLRRAKATAGSSNGQQAPTTKDVAPVIEVLPPEGTGTMVPGQSTFDPLALPTIPDRRASADADDDVAFAALVAMFRRAPQGAQARFREFLHNEKQAEGD